MTKEEIFSHAYMYIAIVITFIGMRFDIFQLHLLGLSLLIAFAIICMKKYDPFKRIRSKPFKEKAASIAIFLIIYLLTYVAIDTIYNKTFNSCVESCILEESKDKEFCKVLCYFELKDFD